MALAVPTTQDVADTLVAHLQASLSQSIPLLPKAFVRVLAKVLAGVFILVYKYAGFIFLQIFVQHATMKETTINGRKVRPLVEWGRLVGVGDPREATRAELVIEVTVTNQTGSLAGGSQLLRGATGVLYQTVTVRPLDAPTVTVTMRASSDQSGGDGSGAIGNLETGDVVSFANPLPNVGRDATVLSQTVTAADAETEDEYRARIFKRFQRKPQGGAYADYQLWGEEVAGIAHVYPYAGDPGQVDVFVEATVESSGDPDGIPTGAQLTAVFDSINLDQGGLASRRPVNAAVNVLPITRTAFDVKVFGLDAADLSGTQADLEAGIDEFLRGREPFIVGLSVLPREDRITAASVGGVVEGIVSAAGGSLTKLELFKGGLQIDAYTLTTGEKAKFGSPTYV